MANLRFRLTIISVGLVLIALALGWYAPTLIKMLPDQVTTVHLLAAAFVFIGLCGIAFYSLMERALNPVMRLIDMFIRVRAGDLDPRLPVEGPVEMCRMGRGFNDMVEDLETQIRDIEVEKQSAELERQTMEDQFLKNERFRWTIDAAPVGIVITDPGLQVVYQNPASESGFLQLESFGGVDAHIVGKPIASLYPDDADVGSTLSDPDRLPLESSITVGPHCLHFSANAAFDQDEEFAGVVLIWEETETLEASDDSERVLKAEETFEKVDELAEVEEFEAAIEDNPDNTCELIDDEEVSDPEPGQNGVPAAEGEASDEVRRTARLVKRSVSVLADRLEGVTSTVDALCDEGDSLRRTIDDIQTQAARADRLVDERSEPLRDLVDDHEHVSARRETAAVLARSLRNGLGDAGELDQAMNRLRGSIEHLVFSSKVELGRMGDEGGGMRVVVDAIGDLGEEARRLGESTHTCLRELRDRVDDVIDLVKAEGHHAASVTRLSARAEQALVRIREGQSETTQRNDLLVEMARGQAEIAQHIAKQINELAGLVGLTSKVAVEQVEIVEGVHPAE